MLGKLKCKLLKQIRRSSQRTAVELLESLDGDFVRSILRKQDVISYILEHGHGGIVDWLQAR